MSDCQSRQKVIKWLEDCQTSPLVEVTTSFNDFDTDSTFDKYLLFRNEQEDALSSTFVVNKIKT